MINFGFCEDDLTGKVKLFYTGDEVNYDRIIVKETKQLFDHFSNPVIDTFLSGVSTIELDLKVGGVFPIELCFLKYYEETYTINKNELHQTGILSDFIDIDFVYVEGFYRIDKSMSSNDMLFLQRPIDKLGPLFAVKSVRHCVNYLTPVKNAVVNKVLNFNINDNAEKELIRDTLLKIDLIRLQTDCDKRIQLYKSIAL